MVAGAMITSMIAIAGGIVLAAIFLFVGIPLLLHAIAEMIYGVGAACYYCLLPLMVAGEQLGVLPKAPLNSLTPQQRYALFFRQLRMWGLLWAASGLPLILSDTLETSRTQSQLGIAAMICGTLFLAVTYLDERLKEKWIVPGSIIVCVVALLGMLFVVRN